MFITLVVISCFYGEVCNRPKDIERVTINTSYIKEVHDIKYYWREDITVTDNGDVVPNKGATQMNGCRVNLKDEQKSFYTEQSCDNSVRPKLSGK